jgi:hypothetical protein
MSGHLRYLGNLPRGMTSSHSRVTSKQNIKINNDLLQFWFIYS